MLTVPFSGFGRDAQVAHKREHIIRISCFGCIQVSPVRVIVCSFVSWIEIGSDSSWNEFCQPVVEYSPKINSMNKIFLVNTLLLTSKSWANFYATVECCITANILLVQVLYSGRMLCCTVFVCAVSAIMHPPQCERSVSNDVRLLTCAPHSINNVICVRDVD